METLDLDKATTHWCPLCHAWMDIRFERQVLEIEGVKVTLDDIPLLNCSGCKCTQLPDHAKRLVAHYVQQAKRNGTSEVMLKPTGVLAKRFPFGKVEFLYSALDHD